MTRRSPLALWQANFVKTQLEQIHNHLQITIIPVTTEGDRILDKPLYKVGGKGLFLKELEEGLLQDKADIAVHSMKDVPALLPKGLCIPVILKREDPREALVTKSTATLSTATFNNLEKGSFNNLEQGSLIGSSSLRRACQVLALRSDLQFKTLRGNVDTRLKKLDQGEYDAIILAAAGLKRLGFANRINTYWSTEEVVPAIGQGALGIECKVDHNVQKLIAPLNDKISSQCLIAERSMNLLLGGSCVTPVAGYCALREDGLLQLTGLVGDPNTNRIIRVQKTFPFKNPELLGESVAQKLMDEGALEIIANTCGHP